MVGRKNSLLTGRDILQDQAPERVAFIGVEKRKGEHIHTNHTIWKRAETQCNLMKCSSGVQTHWVCKDRNGEEVDQGNSHILFLGSL